MTTIKDVAKNVGVSVSTVSRALNNSGYVKDDVKKKIIEAAEALSYKPNIIARSLKRNSTQTIGLVVSDITNPFFASIAKAADEYLSQFGYNMIICNTDESASKELSHIKQLHERRVEGIIICPSGMCNDYINEIIQQKIKVILVDRYYEDLDLDVIKDDNVYGSYIITKHMIERGHSKIALIKGASASTTSIEREKGFRDAFVQNNIPISEDCIFSGGKSGELTLDVVKHILEMPNRPTAIYALNPLIAKQVIIAINSTDLSIPKDMALASYGLEEFKNLYKPSITCIIQQPERIGFMAANLMIERIQNDVDIRKKQLILTPELFIGGSV